MPTFSSEIFIIGVNPYVPVPDEILQSLFAAAKKTKGPIPVKGTLNGSPFTQTVVKYSNVWRLYLNGMMLKGTGLKLGDIAHIEITYDHRSRAEKMPEKLAKLFETHARARDEFLKLPPYRQKEILRYLNSLKAEETLDRNIQKVLNHFNGRKESLIVLSYDRLKKK